MPTYVNDETELHFNNVPTISPRPVNTTYVDLPWSDSLTGSFINSAYTVTSTAGLWNYPMVGESFTGQFSSRLHWSNSLVDQTDIYIKNLMISKTKLLGILDKRIGSETNGKKRKPTPNTYTTGVLPLSEKSIAYLKSWLLLRTRIKGDGRRYFSVDDIYMHLREVQLLPKRILDKEIVKIYTAITTKGMVLETLVDIPFSWIKYLDKKLICGSEGLLTADQEEIDKVVKIYDTAGVNYERLAKSCNRSIYKLDLMLPNLSVIELLRNHPATLIMMMVLDKLIDRGLIEERDLAKLKVTETENEGDFFYILGYNSRKLMKTLLGVTFYQMYAKSAKDNFDGWGWLVPNGCTPYAINLKTYLELEFKRTSDSDFLDVLKGGTTDVQVEEFLDKPIGSDMLVKDFICYLEKHRNFASVEHVVVIDGLTMNCHTHSVLAQLSLKVIAGEIDTCKTWRENFDIVLNQECARVRETIVNSYSNTNFIEAVVDLEKVYPSHYIRIRNGIGLYNEGKLMHNCIGSYSEECESNSLVYRGMFNSKLYTIEIKQRTCTGDVDVMYVLNEVKGIYNADPDETVISQIRDDFNYAIELYNKAGNVKIAPSIKDYT